MTELSEQLIDGLLRLRYRLFFSPCPAPASFFSSAAPGQISEDFIDALRAQLKPEPSHDPPELTPSC